MREDTWRTNVSHGLNRAMMEWFIGHYLPPGADPTDPIASPVFTKDLRGVAPATIIAAEFDPLIGEEATYYAAADAGGRRGRDADLERHAARLLRDDEALSGSARSD